MRVPDYLLDQHVTFQTVYHPPAFTSQKRARFLHISGRQVVKCVLLASGKGFILAVLRAVDHVDLAALAKTLGMNVRLASDDELAEQFGDCEPGGWRRSEVFMVCGLFWTTAFFRNRSSSLKRSAMPSRFA